MASQARIWSLADAKTHFSEVIDRALDEGPQTITRRGRETAVIVSTEEWRRKTRRKGNLAEFFMNSPLRDSGLVIPEREKDWPPAIEL